MKLSGIVLFSGYVFVVLQLFIGSVSAVATETKLVPVPIKGTSFEIQIPANWGKGAFSGKSILLCKSPGKVLYPNLNIVKEEKKGRSASQSFTRWATKQNNARIAENRAIIINTIPAHLGMAAWSSPLGNLITVKLFVEMDNHLLIISYVGRENNTTKADLALYSRSLNSLRILNT